MKIFNQTCALLLFINGCSVTQIGPTHVNDVGVFVRKDLPIYQTKTRSIVGWGFLLESIKGVDVILLGEQHDHATGHAVELAIVEDVMNKYPGSTLALEMLERDEQPVVDDFMENFIDSDTLEKITLSTNWGGSGGWMAWYQPIIDATKKCGGGVVAANAPRRYVRIARTDGFGRIDELPKNRRVYVDYPERLSDGRYRQRFWELAASMHGGDSEEPFEDLTEIDVSTIDPKDPVLPVFRSQQVWDATMAQSIVNARPSISKKVVLLVGQFHVEYEGGVVQELKKRMPNVRIAVISIQREIPDEAWWGNDKHPPIADFMIVGE